MISLLTRATVVGTTVLALFGSGFAASAPQTATAPAPKEVAFVGEDILDDYISGVDEDTQKYVGELDVIVSGFVSDAVSIVGDTLEKGGNPEDMAEEIEKKAEEFADTLEDVSDIFGDKQEDAGDAFGDKFDQHTAEAVVNVVWNILFKKR